jgi:hypothetical protein
LISESLSGFHTKADGVGFEPTKVLTHMISNHAP